MNKISTKKNFILYYMYQVSILLSTIITTPYISKNLGSENVGIYSFTFAIANFIYMFSQLGTYTYGVRQIALCKDDNDTLSKTFFEIFLMKLLSTVFFLIIYLIFIRFQVNYKLYFYIWILFIIAAAFDITWFYGGIEHFEEIFVINIIVRIIGIISTFLFVTNKNTLWIYMIIHSLMYLLPFSLMWISLFKYISFKNIHHFSIVNHFNQSLIYFIPTIAASLFMVIDKSMLGFIVENKKENGYYEMSSQIITFSKTLSAIVISHIFVPKTTNYYKYNDREKTNKTLCISLDWTAFICFGVIFGILAISNTFVPIFYGLDFLPVGNLLRTMSPLVFITALSYVLEYEYLVPAGKGKLINKFILISSLLNIILNSILIKYLKSTGVVISSIITESILLYFFYKESDSIIKANTIFNICSKKIISGFIMLVVIVLTNYLFNYIHYSNQIIILISEILIGGIVYILSLYLFKDNIFNFVNEMNNL